jgi:MarR family transcriptional regulator, organic hydroperoxide resistance regulator
MFCVQNNMVKNNDAPPLGPVLDFMRLLWAINHVLATTSKRMKARFGITAPQRLVVRIVGRFPGVSAGRLAEILHLHPSTLTGILIRLEARGFVTRRVDSRDRRRVRVRLTRRGQRLTRPAVGSVEAAVERALADFREENITIAQEILANIARVLEDRDAAARADAE